MAFSVELQNVGDLSNKKPPHSGPAVVYPIPEGALSIVSPSDGGQAPSRLARRA